MYGSGFNDRNGDDHASLPSQISRPSQRRRSSYAAVAASRYRTAGRPAAAVYHLLNPSSSSPSSPDGSADDAMNRSHFYSSVRDYDRNTMTHITNTAGVHGEQQPQQSDASARAASGILWPKSSGLPWHSRAYNLLMAPESYLSPDDQSSDGGNLSQRTSFLSPSYLRGTVYMELLEEQHKRRLQAVHEGKHAHLHGGSGVVKSSGITLGLDRGNLPSSHRGMALEVVEKAPRLASGSSAIDGGGDEDEPATVSPLPSRWSHDDKHGALDVVQDGYNVKYVGPKSSSEKDNEACAVRADHFIPSQCGVYYFEVTIVSRKHSDTTFAVGISGKTASLNRPPGWEPASWGYHGDDGHLFTAQILQGRAYGPKYGPGDTIGCLVNFRTGTINFTKNGNDLGIAFRDQSLKQEQGNYFPSLGLKKPGDHVWTNFGQVPFQFDIDGYVKMEKQNTWGKIRQADTSKLVPGMKESELIQQLVLQHLQHDGYVETARAFAEEIVEEKKRLRLDPNEPVASINVRDDEDARKRQQIRRTILEGDVDLALKYTNMYYPNVLKSNKEVYFRLRCRKFIEMIRQADEENLKRDKIGPSSSDHTTTTSAKASGRSNGHPHFDPSTEMEVDETNGGGETGWAGDDDTMEEDDDDDVVQPETPPPVGQLLQELLAYGQELRAELVDRQASATGKDEGDLDRGRQLDSIFALIAYENPLKEEGVKHLLDRGGRVAVAEELNSAILLSLGKSSRSALENMYAQTAVLLEQLREDGGDGALVGIQDIMDRIAKPEIRTN